MWNAFLWTSLKALPHRVVSRRQPHRLFFDVMNSPNDEKPVKLLALGNLMILGCRRSF